jgi:hypothetical protein
MNLGDVPAEFVDDFFGDSDTRRALEHVQKTIPTFDSVADATGFSDTGIIDELEKAALLELFIGADSVGARPTMQSGGEHKLDGHQSTATPTTTETGLMKNSSGKIMRNGRGEAWDAVASRWVNA